MQHISNFAGALAISSFILLSADAQPPPVTSNIDKNSSECEPQHAHIFAACRVDATERISLAERDRSLLPALGFVLWSGGFMSSVGVYAFDAESRRLSLLRSPSLERALERDDLRHSIALTAQQADALVVLSNRIWSSHERFINNPPNADQNVRLVLAAEADVKDISSYGPARGALSDLFSRVLEIVNAHVLEQQDAQ